jgi:N6-L-threonylcarbamoyladenine synthase
MVAALGAELLAAGVPPSSLEFPADSSMPVTTVVAA